MLKPRLICMRWLKSTGLLLLLLLLWLMLSACQIPSSEAAPQVAEMVTISGHEGQKIEVAIPATKPDQTNVAFVYAGQPFDKLRAPPQGIAPTGGHEVGRLYLEEHGEDIHTVALWDVPEGDEAEEVMRALAREGFEVIFGTSFGYMDAMERVATEFPETAFVHISGHKNAEPNFGNVFGAMEEMKYLAGMVAGAKAAKNASSRIGIIATSFEQPARGQPASRGMPSTMAIRLSNATVLGMKQTCRDCVADIRWIFSASAASEHQNQVAAAESLMDEGAGVIVTDAGSREVVEAVAKRGLSVIVGGTDQGGTSDSLYCEQLSEYCLGVTYWDWGPLYLRIVNEVVARTWVPEDFYGSTADGILGFYGFMEGQTPTAAVPASVIGEVSAVLAEMQAGRFNRFDIFRGPLKDNQGQLIIPAGKRLTQSDLQGFTTQYLVSLGVTNRELCTHCMDFLVEGVVPEAAIKATGRAKADPSEASRQERTPEAKEVVVFWTTDSQPERVAVYEAVAKRYMAAHPNHANIEIQIVPVEEAELIPKLSQTDELPDIVRIGVERVPVLAADRLLDQAASEAVIARIGADEFQEGLLEMVTDPATRFYAAVPFDGWVQAIWYRQDLFNELGLPPPTTWETIARANRTLASTGQLRYGVTLGTSPEQNYGHQLFEQVAISAGAYPFDAEGNVTMNTPEMIQALKWYTDLQAYALPGSHYWRGAREAYEQDQTGMLFYSTYIMDDLVDGSGLEDGGQVEITVEELAPKSGFAAQIVGPGGSATYGQLVTLGILRDADPAAQDVVEFYLTDGYQEIIALAPFGKIPVLKSSIPGWKQSSDYFEFYSDDTLNQIAAGYKTMQRWVLRPDYTLTQRAVIGDIESRLLIPQVIHQITIQGTMTPESAAEFLQEEVENLVAERSGE